MTKDKAWNFYLKGCVMRIVLDGVVMPISFVLVRDMFIVYNSPFRYQTWMKTSLDDYLQ
jgi:hypothetical protein